MTSSIQHPSESKLDPSVDDDASRHQIEATSHRPFWCDVCSLDLQSSSSLAQHRLGRKHTRKEFWKSSSEGNTTSSTSASAFKRPPSSVLDSLTETEVFQGLASNRYSNVVVLTGAGISTSAGVPDFRSPGGVFDTIRQRYGRRFPEVLDHPESALSRGFAIRHPDVVDEIRREIKLDYDREKVLPTKTHEFCAWLHRRGALRRIYTQNIDGLHTHPSLVVPPDVVVECHGSLASRLVMYGDGLPRRFYDCCDVDFAPKNNKQDSDRVDLLLVFGTSLQVAPFCAVPNMAPRGSARVLVNRDVEVCLSNSFSNRRSNSEGLCQVTNCRIGSRKDVPLRSLWSGREGNKKWRQLLVEEDCDTFVTRFFDSEYAVEASCDIKS
ncbi:hypothetical protein ACHAWF_011694 [Thalassiosira exigua]